MNDSEQLFQSAKAAFECCAQSMCLTTELPYSEIVEQVPPDLAGAYLTLVADQGSVIIGIVSDRKGLEFLTRTMLGMEPSDDEVEIADIADAMGELANVWGGQYKTDLASELQNIRIGLPMFAHGRIDAPRTSHTRIFKLVIDVIPVFIYISESLDEPVARKSDRSGKAA